MAALPRAAAKSRPTPCEGDLGSIARGSQKKNRKTKGTTNTMAQKSPSPEIGKSSSVLEGQIVFEKKKSQDCLGKKKANFGGE